MPNIIIGLIAVVASATCFADPIKVFTATVAPEEVEAAPVDEATFKTAEGSSVFTSASLISRLRPTTPINWNIDQEFVTEADAAAAVQQLCTIKSIENTDLELCGGPGGQIQPCFHLGAGTFYGQIKTITYAIRDLGGVALPQIRRVNCARD